MYSSRAFSASRPSRVSQKPAMQQKWKQRAGSQSLEPFQPTQSCYIDNQQDQTRKQGKETPASKIRNQVNKAQRQRNSGKRDMAGLANGKYTQRKRSGSDIRNENKKCAMDSDDFMRTSRKLSKFNFSHHKPNECVCALCTCGRHLCKLHAISPNLSKASIYNTDYPWKTGIPNNVFKATQSDRLHGPNLEMNSTYLKDYPGKTGDDVFRPKPEDLLKSGGPCPNLTSYSSQFPGYRGPNQHVPHTDRHTRDSFPLRGRSTYADAFPGKSPSKSDWQRNPDNLKTGKNWFGESGYGNNFKNPSKDDYPLHIKLQEKAHKIPDYNKQFETTYKNNFLDLGSTVCPAKIELETRKKGLFRNSKTNFNESMDFKALSPQFKAISTSKFSYA